MKKLKIKKRMSSFLMLAVMVVSIIGSIPITDAFAKVEYSGGQISRSSHFNHSYSYKDPNGTDTKVTYNLGTVDSNYLYLIEFAYSDYSDYVFASYGDFSGTVTYESGDDSSSRSISSTAVDCGKYGRIYITSPYTDIPSKFPHLKYKMSQLNELRDSGKLDLCGGENMYMHFCAKVCNYKGRYSGDMETIVECGEGIPDGSSTNPIRDKSVGYPDIYDYKFLISSPSTDGEWDKLKNADYIKWKSKSTTGFNLINPDSKYKNVYIQAKIVSRFQYNDSFWGNGDWHNYDNYGEEGYFDFINPSDKELTVTFQQLTELLPKTHAEKHNFKKYNFDYDYYFRIVYTRADDLKVIPTYYSGGWRRVSCHSNNGKHDENGEGDNSSAIITDGDDEGGEWKTDKDSKDNDKNIDNGTGEGSDLEDAKDDADNKKNDSSSGSLDIDSIKGFMDEVGNVPKAIGKLFSFLPDWVTTFIGFGFVVLVALIIIKAIRG